MLSLAAKGDRDALACLRDTFVEEATNADPIYAPGDLWAQAEIFARLAAEHSQPVDIAVLATIPLVPGAIRLEVPFAANWTAVLHSSRDTNPQAYADALRNAARVGFTIGNVTGLGHGSNPPGALRGVRISVR